MYLALSLSFPLHKKYYLYGQLPFFTLSPHPTSSFSVSRLSVCRERKLKERGKHNGLFQTDEWSRGFNMQLRQEKVESKTGVIRGNGKQKCMLKTEPE